MGDVLAWLKGYSKPIAILIVIGAAALFVLRTVVEESVSSTFEANRKELELRLARRSGFEDRLLTERFALVTSLTARLERAATDINRERRGLSPMQPRRGGELLGLTAIFEDLSVKRVILGEDFYRLLQTKAELALRLANAQSEAEYEQLGDQWLARNVTLRAAVEETFRVSEVRP